MILSNVDIRKVLQEGALVIDPLPEEIQIDSTSIDLRMGESLWKWDEELIRETGFRVNVGQFNYKELSERFLGEVARETSGTYLIQPHTVYLAATFEKIELPSQSRLAARIEGKSSLARLGLSVHITAPTIHCGTGLGIITLEIFNQGAFSIEVMPGVSRICQLILEQVLSEPEERITRTFKDQKSPKG